MHATTILKMPRKLWSRFAKWRTFHSRYGLAQVVAFISTGHWQNRWSWQSGTLTQAGSNAPPKISVWKLTRHAQLTLVRFYVFREPITMDAESSSKQVQQ